MWKLCLCFIVTLLQIRNGVYASLGDILSETSQLCCNQGTTYARSHSLEDCSSSTPPEVPSAYGSFCIFAMDQCCKEYFLKKTDCDNGVDMAYRNKSCGTSKDPSKKCCEQCLAGMTVGKSRGESACSIPNSGNSAEQMLGADVFTHCCKNAANEKPSKPTEPTTQRSKKPDEVSGAYSLCEEYAPNELCAHHCIPMPMSYKCECNPGFMLMPDGKNCKEVTKNRCKPHNPCQHKCNDNGIEVKCSCRRGYQLLEDQKSCEDIDECTLQPQVCLPYTKCLNVLGSYKCIPLRQKPKDKGTCPPGFARNLLNNACDDINECKLPNPPCASYLCENTIGGYKCGGVSGDPASLTNKRPTTEDRCPPGFRSAQNDECEDVDECTLSIDDCNKLSQFCINTRGSFYCQDKASKHCPPGFKINPSNNICEDINECDEGQDICRPDQICVNVPGEYDCRPKENRNRYTGKCPDGMRLNPETKVCEDINECIEGTHLCDQYQKCLNTNGSHECICKLGFEMDRTTGACVDVNECATDQNTCIPESQRCDNTVGSYLCIRFISCGTGYILHHSSSTCEDVDECALGTHNCDRAGPEYHCVNIPGSFRCQRKPTSPPPPPTPEYEYEYYDSDEEIETAKKSDSVTTTTPQIVTVPVTTPSTTPIPKPTEAVIPEKQPEINKIDQDIPEIYEEPAPTEIVKLEDLPDRDIYNTIDSSPVEIPDEGKNIQKKPETEYPNLKPPASTEQTIEISETTYSPITELTSPKMVYVKEGQNTVAVEAQKHEDGSVVLDTEDIPKNRWTKINERPSNNCPPGFELDNYGVCSDIDECTTNRHTCSGLTESCRNTRGGYLCDCALGFRRDLFSGACVLIPSSTSTSTSTTTSTSTPPITEASVPTSSSTRSYFWNFNNYRPAKSRPFKPMSNCDAGYHYNIHLGKCEDIDECTNGLATCAAVELCVNTEGGFRCDCQPNWRLDPDRQRCVPAVNNGRLPPGYENQFVNTVVNPPEVRMDNKVPEKEPVEEGSPEFSCPWGSQLSDDNTCVDIDECATGEAKCGPLQICTNLEGGYTCSCPKGHKLVDDHICEDVDECALAGSSPICSQNADCVNTIGSYRCQCHEGFKAAPVNDKVCVDVDECSEERSGSLCTQRCNNVWGGYRCSCFRGYRLNPDNRTCSDVDECVEFRSKNPCVGKCVNEQGSYKCTCPSGYRLSDDKRSCIDIDECETGIAPCARGSKYEGASDVCLNTRGGYRCHRITCSPGYRLESKHRCTKVQTYCTPSDWECAHQPSTYSYNFITFVSKLYIPESKVDLFTMRGPNWSYAKMRFELKLVNVDTPPSVREKADINSFLLVQTDHQAVVSLVRSLEGPQTIELELSMELYSRGQFGGTAVAKLYIFVSEYEF
ncbi:fibulin-2-like [Leptidea sinapis]|uniref:fibulin-2-like n=1 Tax=Leptidea sinapis TaxID=189913 RepID=UPI00213E84DD|nr:fibulin-2-like [Leptidea sinapis]